MPLKNKKLSASVVKAWFNEAIVKEAAYLVVSYERTSGVATGHFIDSDTKLLNALEAFSKKQSLVKFSEHVIDGVYDTKIEWKEHLVNNPATLTMP